MDKHRLQKFLMKSSAFKNVPEKAGDRHRAFTLIELVVVIAVVALLAVMCLSAMAKTRPNTQAFQCMNNHKQLIMAWRMYASDNNDTLVSAQSLFPQVRPIWINGNLSFNTTIAGNYDPRVYIQTGPLWNYCGNQPAIFRCPTDPTVITVTNPPAGLSAGQYPRVRSISMSQVFGNGDWQPASAWKLYSTVTSINLPAQIFVFVDEHPQSINDAAFGWSDTPQAIVDYPASLHDGRAADFGFADGHTEIHRWQGAAISPPYIPGSTSTLPAGRKTVTAPEDVADVAWVSAHNAVP